jgi:hypothetical protein
MKSNQLALTLFGLFLVFGSIGCSSSVSIPAWQRNVESYVKEQGAGDPGVLRNMTWKGTHRGFSVISHDNPAVSTDVIGVLVAHQVLADKPWFVFLVGQVDKQKVSDIRAAALSVENGKFNWRIGNKDPEALKAYRAYNDKQWHERFPGRKDAPPDYLGFPREDDVFEETAQPDEVRITHPPSGAQWEVKLAAGKKR